MHADLTSAATRADSSRLPRWTIQMRPPRRRLQAARSWTPARWVPVDTATVNGKRKMTRIRQLKLTTLRRSIRASGYPIPLPYSGSRESGAEGGR